MRSPAALPKSILIVELVGMALLTLAAVIKPVCSTACAICQPDGGAHHDLCRDPADDPGGDSLNVANSENCRAAVDR